MFGSSRHGRCSITTGCQKEVFIDTSLAHHLVVIVLICFSIVFSKKKKPDDVEGPHRGDNSLRQSVSLGYLHFGVSCFTPMGWKISRADFPFTSSSTFLPSSSLWHSQKKKKYIYFTDFLDSFEFKARTSTPLAIVVSFTSFVRQRMKENVRYPARLYPFWKKFSLRHRLNLKRLAGTPVWFVLARGDLIFPVIRQMKERRTLMGMKRQRSMKTGYVARCLRELLGQLL